MVLVAGVQIGIAVVTVRAAREQRGVAVAVQVDAVAAIAVLVDVVAERIVGTRVDGGVGRVAVIGVEDLVAIEVVQCGATRSRDAAASHQHNEGEQARVGTIHPSMLAESRLDSG